MKTLEMIVPCFNEESSVEPFYKRITEVFSSMDGVECGLIFVDDGSGDGTLGRIRALAESDKKVKYISFSRNFGKEGAMLAGLTFSKADFVGIIDVDLQHDPALIPEMFAAVESGEYDVAAAKRSDRSGEKKLKSALSSAFYGLSNLVSDVKIDSGAQDFRVMSRPVVDAIVSLTEKNRFTKGIFSFVGFKTKWFEHENSSRVSGRSKWSLKKLLSYAITGIISNTNMPLRIPLWLGIILIILSGIYAIILLVEPPTIRSTATRRVLAGVFFIGGLILFCQGIVGQYLARIYTEVKNRPAFIIRETNIN